ncbi:hypothetical protein N8I74_14115 [Chitiniphilus purpureus]|uniref:PQ-loop repeat-containing protein n=1 Tax=Chitiniphilus purpureus TaxID=2981137 RepID=A0ABY6DJ98_9NEIS|nr:hypothetical protein [Chitiniphilus sp. CD1]UXY14444.1 hypothetical protein N8I74_14115 [Chitiniphilus sp. CD1]
MPIQIIGLVSALILIATLIRQIYIQWHSTDLNGVSGWLFAGQMCASAGFMLYSYLIGDALFVLVNVLGLTTALVGQGIYLYKLHQLSPAGATRIASARAVPARVARRKSDRRVGSQLARPRR